MTLDLVSSALMLWILRTVVGLSFLYYGVAKLRNLPAFVEGAVRWEVLRPATTRPLAQVLPFVEVTVGAALLSGQAVHAAAMAALLTFGVFASAVTYNLSRGKRVPCFCAGAASNERIGVATLLRIAVLGSFAYAVGTHPATSAILPPPGRVAILTASILISMITLLEFLPALEVAVREVVAVRHDRRAVRALDALSQAAASETRGA